MAKFEVNVQTNSGIYVNAKNWEEAIKKAFKVLEKDLTSYITTAVYNEHGEQVA